MAFRRSISIPASILTFAAVCILVSLGVWQVRRLEEKTAFIRQMDAAYAAPQNHGARRGDTEGQAQVFGRFEGVFLTDKAFSFGTKVRDGQPGADLIVPLRTAEGDVLVNLGFVDLSFDRKSLGELANRSVWVEGLARKSSWNRFTPQNQPERDIWYRLDIPEIARAKGLERPWALAVYAERASHLLPQGLPNNTRFYPNNNHLQYALFWFAMAGVLVAVYVLRFVVSPQERR